MLTPVACASPCSQGYTLDQFDRADEGEISQLNREVAKREEDELYKRFQSNLLFNLGMVSLVVFEGEFTIFY